MAEINAQIPLMAQAAKMPDLTEMYGNAANMVNLMQQTQLNRMNFQGQQALNAALQDQSNLDPNTGMPDPMKVQTALAKSGLGATQPVQSFLGNQATLTKNRAETSKALADTQKALQESQVAHMDTQSKLLGIEGQLLSGIHDQASYDSVMGLAKNVDPNAFKDAPPQYDPNYVQSRMNMAVQVNDQIKNKIATFNAGSQRMEAQAAAQNASTNAGRLGLDTAQAQNQPISTPTGVFSFNRLTGAPSGASAGGKPAVAINPQQVASLETSGHNYANQLADYQKEAVQTGTDLNQLKQLSALSDKADLGPGASKVGALRNLYATYVGQGDTSKISANAMIDQIANRLILNARNNSDTRVAGAFTKAQQELEASSQLERTDPSAAFKAKVQALMDLRQREGQVAQSAVDYADKNGGILDNAFFQQAAQATKQPLYQGQQATKKDYSHHWSSP